MLHLLKRKLQVHLKFHKKLINIKPSKILEKKTFIRLLSKILSLGVNTQNVSIKVVIRLGFIECGPDAR